MTRPRVAAVIVSFNTRELTLRAIESVLSSDGVEPEVWVVDNASSDGSVDAVRTRFTVVRLIALERNVGFGRASNAALTEIDAPYALFLNSDAAFLDRTGLARLIASLEGRPEAGAVGPLLEGSDGRIGYSARNFPSMIEDVVRGVGLHSLFPSSLRDRWLAREFRDHTRASAADWLTGACLLTRADVLRVVGGFDPALFLYGEDLDWCWRVGEAGWDVVLEPAIRLYHEGGASSGAPSDWRSRVAMASEAYVVRKHRGRGYFAVFASVRGVAFALRWLLHGVVGVVTRSESRRRQSRTARFFLAYWLFALRHGATTDPGSERFLDAAGFPG